MHAQGDDSICNYLKYLNFFNQKEFRTKLIFVPSYLNGDDKIFNISYYDLLIGMDMTVFPSYYEPWGYTPLESIAFNIPTITTNLAGFGLWARMEESPEIDLNQGVEVIDRTEDNYFDVAEKIKDKILFYAQSDKSKINDIREAAGALSEKACWSHFIHYYQKAYDIALRKARKRTKNQTI